MTAATEKTTVVVLATTEKNAADDEVSQIWLEVQNRVIRMAGGDPSKIDKQLDVDGVMRYLEQTQAADQKAADKHGTVKKAFNRTLNCISKVGGIIADGASYVRFSTDILTKMFHADRRVSGSGLRPGKHLFQRSHLCDWGMAVILGGFRESRGTA